MKKAILRIKTPPVVDIGRPNSPAGVYVGSECEVTVIDAATRDTIAVLENVQHVTIDIPSDDFISAKIVTDWLELDIEVEGTIVSEKVVP
jgi:hypothetical protein